MIFLKCVRKREKTPDYNFLETSFKAVTIFPDTQWSHFTASSISSPMVVGLRILCLISLLKTKKEHFQHVKHKLHIK